MRQSSASLKGRASSTVQWAVEQWRTSIQLRVLTSVVVVSATVVAFVGFALASLVAQSLLDSKVNAADEEIDRARSIVEQAIETSGASTLQAQLNVGRDALMERVAQDSGGALSTYEPLLLAPVTRDNSIVSSPINAEVPTYLREMVLQNQVAYQVTEYENQSGENYAALIIGTPTSTSVENLELYLVMPMTAEEVTLNLIRGLLIAAMVVITLLLAVITWFFANQVTAPLGAASKIAQRWADGHLRERMQVRGDDDMARLAMSFNSMAESLSQQIRSLEKYNDLQRQFTSDVSHELRTPLTTVRMAAELIADEAETLDIAGQRAAELMISELDRFEMLLNDLLEISSHDAGVAALSDENMDVRQCIEAAHRQVAVVAQETGTEIRIHMPEEPLMAVVDSRRIERVLRNLMANAVDHSEGNPVDVTVAANDSTMAFTVVDHGVGLQPEQENLVFNRFWRADSSRVRRTGGTGLGLAIAREDALLHGGDLEAKGIPGVGSCFRLTIPLVPKEPLGVSPLPMDIPPLAAGDVTGGDVTAGEAADTDTDPAGAAEASARTTAEHPAGELAAELAAELAETYTGEPEDTTTEQLSLSDTDAEDGPHEHGQER